MKEIGLVEAKTRLSELVRQVQAGESFVITEKGQPAAELVPTRRKAQRKPRQIAEGIRNLRNAQRISGVPHEEIRAWIEEGRE